MEVNQVSIAHDYEEHLDDDEEIFLSRADEIINKYSDNICEQIKEEIYMLKSVNIPKGDPRLKKKIMDELYLGIVDEYGSTIHANKINQANQLRNLYQGMSIHEVGNIQFDVINLEKDAGNIKRKIIDRIITYFNFENQGNSMYWEKSRQVEEIVKKEVKLDNIELIIQKIEEIYIETLEQMKFHNERFKFDFGDDSKSENIEENLIKK